MAQRSIPAAEFADKCLSVLDQLLADGVLIVITKNGRPIARVEPIAYPIASDLHGSLRREADLISPTWHET